MMDIFNNAAFGGQVAVGLFFSIVFIQSGFDKILNWTGNMEWLSGHFAKTFLARFLAPVFAILTLFEVFAGVLCATGCLILLLTGSHQILLYGLYLCLLALLMLIFGQRVAQDYDGARTIAVYFAVGVLGLQFF